MKCPVAFWDVVQRKDIKLHCQTLNYISLERKYAICLQLCHSVLNQNNFFLPLLKFCLLWKIFYFLLSRRGNEYGHINRSCWFCGICLKAMEGVKYQIILGGFSQLLEFLFEVKVGYWSFKKDLCSKQCWSNISTIFPFHGYCCYPAIEWVL